MYQIQMVDDFILVVQEQEKNKTDFELVGSGERGTAMYRVRHASNLKPGTLVLLNPGVYEGITWEGEVMTVARESDVIANVEEVQGE